MAQREKILQLSQIILDHFESKISKVNVKVDELLNDSGLGSSKRFELNEMKEKQIKIIKEIEEINLIHFSKQVSIDEYRQDVLDFFDGISSDKFKRELISEKLILFDCVLLENSNLINGFECWITSWFLSEFNFEFLK